MITSVFFSATSGDAAGFFRRLPEVGEWAAFDLSSTQEVIDSETHGTTIELTGTLTVRCVGEEMVEDRRHLWIEWEIESGTSGKIWKVLVSENILVDREPSLDGIRGWEPDFWSDEPVEFSIPYAPVEAVNSTALIFLGGGESGDSDAGERTIEVDGQEHVLTQFDSGPVPKPYERKVENERINYTSEATWWLSEDLAFGVAAVELTGSIVNREDDTESHQEIRFDLVTTGTGAVSELPDHN
jgi:hypothetical protein